MKAEIIHVMESWPLQLSLQLPDRQEQVMLDEQVRIHRGGIPVDPGVLKAGQEVWIHTRSSAGDGRITELEILG